MSCTKPKFGDVEDDAQKHTMECVNNKPFAYVKRLVCKEDSGSFHSYNLYERRNIPAVDYSTLQIHMSSTYSIT